MKPAKHRFLKTLTFYGISKEFIVMDGNQRVAEQRAEQVEERDDAAGVFQRHGGAPRDHLEQWHHRP